MMRLPINRSNAEFNKFITLVLLAVLVFSLPGFINVRPAAAVCGSVGIPSDTLTVKVGYFGGPYYTKKVYSLTDFDTLPQVQQAYTFIDSMGAICVDAAVGVNLSDLLMDAGVDVNSIQTFYFNTNDVEVGWYINLDKYDLLETPRYYYPNLPSHWDYDTKSPMEGALDGAVQVEPIIAYKDNWHRYDPIPCFDNFDTSSRFRLLFGQRDVSEDNAYQSAKWIHTIEIMLGGMPPSQVTLDQDWVNLKVGSTVKLTANIAPAEATEKSVTWSSSNSEAAIVDENGLVTVVGEGSAVITVTTIVGELTASCVINGPEPIAAAPGSGVADSSESPSNGQMEEEVGSSQQHLIDRELTQNAVSLNEAGEQPWRIYQMSADAVALPRQERENVLDPYAAIIFLFLLVYGSGKRYVEFRGR
jgi:hypothetical protein